MSPIEILKIAIDKRQPVSFEYHKDPKTSGVRYGNPHAIFINKTTDNPTADIYQTSGDSSDSQKLPQWRPFILDFIENIQLLEGVFSIADGYVSNPASGKYDRIIAKIQ